MELTKDIEVTEKGIDAEDKKSDYFFAMLNGQTISETITTTRGDFKLKFPKQKDIITIGRMAAFMRGGIPAANFDAASDYEIQKCAALDVMVASGPEWFENARKKDKNFSWRSVPDARFVDEVYAKALEFRLRVQGEIEGTKENDTAKIDEEDAGGVSPDVGDGVFSGTSGSAKRDKH